MSAVARSRRFPPYLRDDAGGDRGLRQGLRARLLPDRLRDARLRQMNEVAAYGGFPTRYPHWRFGMDYEQLSKSYEYGLSKIYEMVINNNPSYAYLLEGNSLVDQKLVMAHVYGHVDFFKNNFSFSQDQPQDDRRDGEPRRARAPLHGALRPGRRRGLHRRLPVAREPDRSACRRTSCGSAEPPKRDDERRATRPSEVPQAARQASTWTRSSTRPSSSRRSRRRRRRSEKAEAKRFPEQPQRDVLAVPARARAARALGARRPRDRPRRGLLLRAAGADQDHERGLGHATGTRRS